MSPGDSYSANIGGSVSGGQIAVGREVDQQQANGVGALSGEERAELHGLLEALRAKVAAEAPESKRAVAAMCVDELEGALVTDEPEPSKIAAIGRWFRDTVPSLASAVASVVIHPIAGKVVGAASQALIDEFAGTAER